MNATTLASCSRCRHRVVKVPQDESYFALVLPDAPWKNVHLIEAPEFQGPIVELLAHYADQHPNVRARFVEKGGCAPGN